MPLTVAYDARPLQPHTRHWGPGIVLDHLLARLAPEFRFTGASHNFPGAAEAGLRTWPAIPKLKNLFFELSPLWLPPCDLFWGTNHFLPRALRQPSVLTVHDLLLLRYPRDQAWSSVAGWLVRSSLERASKVVTVSRTTADDLLASFPQLRAKLEVGLLGFDSPPPASARGAQGAWSSAGPYAIMLGCHRPRKNLNLALGAVTRLADEGRKITLLITGSVHPSFEDPLRKEASIAKKLGVLPRDAVLSLLGSATALLYPSRYEGFGLPMLEAMAAGCPVLALDTPISREIGAQAAWLLPDDPAQWAKALSQLLSSSSRRAEMQGRGFENLQRFSWDQTAATYAQIFREVAR